MTSRTVSVPGISCGHCVSTIEREVGAVGGVAEVSAAESTRDVRVVWDESVTSWDEISGRLREIHYPPAD